MKPICIPCQRFFRCVKNGFYFTEGMPNGRDVEPGTAMPDRWQPYKLWSGDKWRCEGCGAEIVSGTGREAIAEHYQDGFGEQAERLGANQFQVNDC